MTASSLLEAATRLAPDMRMRGARWQELAWVDFYRPFDERDAIARVVATEATRALALDPNNVAAMIARIRVATEAALALRLIRTRLPQ